MVDRNCNNDSSGPVFFMAVRTVTQGSSDKTRMAVYTVYWSISAAAILTIVLFPFVQAMQTNVVFRNNVLRFW